MKISPAAADRFVASPDRKTLAVLLYGPDAGLVRERSKILARTVLDDLDDPFRSKNLSAGAIKSDPALLADEASAMALTGGRLFIRVSDAGDSLAKAATALLDEVQSDALVVFEGGELGPRSTLRKLFESHDKAASIACYGDEGRDLGEVIRDTLSKHNLSAEPDAIKYLAAHLGSDRQVSRGELEKLALYMGENLRVSLEDAMACVGDSGAFSLDNVIYATASGDQNTLETALTRCFQEGNQPIMVLRAMSRHLHKLHVAKGQMAKGQNPDQAIKAVRPPVIFKQAPAFKQQLSNWQTDHLGQAMDILTEAEGDCKTTGMPVETVCRRALMRIAVAARKKRR